MKIFVSDSVLSIIFKIIFLLPLLLIIHIIQEPRLLDFDIILILFFPARRVAVTRFAVFIVGIPFF